MNFPWASSLPRATILLMLPLPQLPPTVTDACAHRDARRTGVRDRQMMPLPAQRRQVYALDRIKALEQANARLRDGDLLRQQKSAGAPSNGRKSHSGRCVASPLSLALSAEVEIVTPSPWVVF